MLKVPPQDDPWEDDYWTRRDDRGWTRSLRRNITRTAGPENSRQNSEIIINVRHYCGEHIK